MNHSNNKKFVQQKGNEGNNFGFIYSRQSQSQKNVNDSIEDGEIISSQKNISPDKLKNTHSGQFFQNIDPEAHDKDSDQVQNGKSRNNNEQIYHSQNLGNENNYNYGQNNYYGQNEKNQQDENDSQIDQSEQKSNENEPEPESMENQEQSQADIFNQNYLSRRINSQLNIGQLSSESNQENGDPQNHRQIQQMQLENDNGFNKYEKKEALKANQQNYEMSGEEAEMAEMQDDEGVDTIGAERKSIYQKALLKRKEGQEQWGKNNINLNTQLNQGLYESMSEENEHDIQSGLLQQYQDEEDSSILYKSQSQIYAQDQNSSCLSADIKQQFDIKIDKFQNSNTLKVPSNQDERTISEMEGTGNKIQGMNENHHDNVNVQDYNMQDADKKEEYEEKQENLRIQNNTNRVSRLGFAEHELSQSNQSSSQSSDQDKKIEDSDQEEQQYIEDVSQSNQSNSKISRSQKSPDQQSQDENDINAKQQIQSLRTQSKDQSKQSENRIQKEEDNQNSQQQYNLQKNNKTAIKSLTGQKKYLSQQEPIFTSAQKAFRIDDQNTSQQIKQKNNQSRISLQVESIEEVENESQKHSNINISERRSINSRQKSKISHVIEEPAQNYQVDQSQNQKIDYSQSQQQTVIGKQSRKSQKTFKSQKSRQTLKRRAYKTDIQDDLSEDNQEKDPENVQENDSQMQLDQNKQNSQDDESDQQEIIENLDEENNAVNEIQVEDNEKSDYEQSDFKIDVEENFIQKDNQICFLRGGSEIDNDEDEPIIDKDQDEEEEQSNQDSAFNYQIECASKNREILDIQNSESKQLSSNIREQCEEISNSLELEESSQQNQFIQKSRHSENLIMEKNSKEQFDNDQKQTQILRDEISYSEEIIESQSENQEYFHEDEDQIEEDSNLNQSDYQIINGQQIKYDPKNIPNERKTEQKNDRIIQKITNSDQIENISKQKQSEQLNDNQDANQDESEEGENFSSPDTSEVDSSSNFDSDLVSEELVIEPLQQELKDDPLNLQRLDESAPAEQTQKPARKQKIKQEKNFASQELSPRKTRGQKDLVQEQLQPKKEIEKFTIQRRPRAVQSKQEIEIQNKNKKSVEKKDDQQKKVKQDNSQNEKKESKQNKTKHNIFEDVEKIEDEVNPCVVINALRKNSRRKVNLNDLKFSQQSLKDNQKSPIKVNEAKKIPIKEKEKNKSPFRVKEKAVKLNYVDKFDLNNQEKSKIQKIQLKA